MSKMRTAEEETEDEEASILKEEHFSSNTAHVVR